MPEQNRLKFVHREVVLSGGSGHPNFVTLQPHLTRSDVAEHQAGHHIKNGFRCSCVANHRTPLRFGEAVICTSDAAANVQDGFR